MHVVIAGAHGQIARRLTRLLAAGGHTVTGVVRNPDHRGDVEADGARVAVLDLEQASVDQVAEVVGGADAVVFAAGAGPGSGVDRKQTVDRGAAVLLADAAEQTAVPRYLLVSSMGTESVRDGAEPDGVDEVFLAYLRAKLAAEDEVRGRDLDWVVLRPGALTDDPGTGRVALAGQVQRGEVPRDDVAAVMSALLADPSVSRCVLELVGGQVPVGEAVRAAVSS